MVLPIEPSLKISNHSPTGFEWGYRGSGPSQLSLAILLEVCGEDIARRYYHTFKEEVIDNLPRNTDSYIQWTIDEAYVKKYIEIKEDIRRSLDRLDEFIDSHKEKQSAKETEI